MLILNRVKLSESFKFVQRQPLAQLATRGSVSRIRIGTTLSATLKEFDIKMLWPALSTSSLYILCLIGGYSLSLKGSDRHTPQLFVTFSLTLFPAMYRMDTGSRAELDSSHTTPAEFAKTVGWIIQCTYVNGETVRLNGGGHVPAFLSKPYV